MLRSLLPSASALSTILLLLPPALCHMEMSWPYPLRSKFNPDTPEGMIDYSMTSPLEASGSNYPCKGYQNDEVKPISITYTAGQTYNMSLAGTATHGGGSCQLSLSYDNGQTFKVIKSMIGGCPLTSSYDFTVPASAPNGEALLGWTWQNKLGNREFYMNCAAVKIVSGSSSKRLRREGQVAMNTLPGVWKANLESVNSCTTSEGEEPVYPEPGPEVEYGDGMSSSSPSSPGNCNGAMAGKAYASPDSSDSSASGSASAPGEYSDSTPSSTGSSSSVTAPASYPTSTSANTMSAGLQTQSTMTVTIDCPSTVTSTLPPTMYTGDSTQPNSLPPMYTTSAPASACTGTSASCPCAPGYDCRSVGTCTWACVAQGLTSSSSGFMTYTVTGSISPTTPAAVQSTSTASAAPAQYTSPPSSSGSTSTPGYATESSLSSYTPCVGGTFLCTSATSFYTCDPSSKTYYSPRQVADGMMCLPFLSPSTSSSGSGQQGNVASGYYRDDRYVRSRPDGSCNTDGALQCTNGGQGFEVCDQGGWVDMGSVAAGTTCQDGSIVAS